MKESGENLLNVKSLKECDLSDIVDKAIEFIHADKEWDSIFPMMIEYKYFIPEGHGDMEEYPNSFRETDHVVAHQSMKYPELYPKIKELIKIVTNKNAINKDRVILADIFEHAGTHYAVELAIVDKKYIKMYAEFLLTNDTYYERFQRFDFVRIVRQWGWCNETYYLLFAYMIWNGEYFHDDVNYLNFNGYSLQKKMQDNKEEEDKFINSLGFFLKEIDYDTENEDLNSKTYGMFMQLVRKQIYTDNFIFPKEKEKSEKLKKRFSEVIERLKNKDSFEQEPPKIIANDIYIQPIEKDIIPEI